MTSKEKGSYMAEIQGGSAVERMQGLYDESAYEDVEEKLTRCRALIERITAQANAKRSRRVEALAEELRKSPTYVGYIERTLLHFFGEDIEEEVLVPVREEGFSHHRSTDEGWRGLMMVADSARSNGEARQQTPVIIDSSITVGATFDDDEYIQREVHILSTHGLFYSRQEVEKDVVMHAFTPERANVVKNSFGLYGVVRTATPESGQTLGQITRGFSESGQRNFCELIRREGRADGQPGSIGAYAYAGVNRSLVAGDDFEPVDTRYTVGWEAVEDLVVAEPTPARKVRAAQNVAFLMRDVPAEEAPMPRVARILAAAQALKDVV